jgi:hypothetical protein
MKADMGIWLGVDKSHTDQNFTRLPDDVRGMIVNQVRREIAIRRDLTYFEDTGTIVTAADDFDYGTPTDFLRPYQMWYYDANDDITYLEQKDRAEWRAIYTPDATENDLPEYYSMYAGNFLLAPCPDDIYTIYYDYYKFPADLSAAGDYDSFLTEGYDAILWECCKRGCGYLMENTRVPLFDAWAKEALGYLSRNHSRAAFSGRRVVSDYSDGT